MCLGTRSAALHGTLLLVFAMANAACSDGSDGAGVPPLDCRGNYVQCGDHCTQLDQDPSNCGACGTVCIASNCLESACDDAVSLTTGGAFTCGLSESGDVWLWGTFLGGAQKSPVKMPDLSQIVDVDATAKSICAVDTSGAGYCIGEGQAGQLGDGSELTKSTVVQVANLTQATAIAVGGTHACAVYGGGKVKCWGQNEGRLGNATAGFREPLPVEVDGIVDAVRIAAGGASTCATRVSGELVCWGRVSISTKISPPSPLGTFGSVKTISMGMSHACVAADSGQAWCWGENDSGQLGTAASSLEPVIADGLSDVVDVAVGDLHSCAVSASGMAYCWGDNRFGQLGDGTTTNRTLPAPVAGLDDAIEIAAGGAFSCARRKTGAVVCWGHNTESQLGDDTTTTRLTPVPVDWNPSYP